jgi:hypothetical protein
VRSRRAALLLALTVVASIVPASPVAAAPLPVAPADSADTTATTVPFAATQTETIAGGVVRRHGRWTTTDGPQVVELIDVDPAAPGISLETSSPGGGVNGVETVRNQAGRVSRNGHRVVAAINGDIWGTDDPSDSRGPIGLQVHNGELYTATRALKPTLGFDAAEQPKMADVSLRMTLTLPDGITSLPIDRVNKPRRSGEFALYTRRWGASTETLANGAEVVLTGAALPFRVSGTWTATVATVRPAAGNTPIPAGALVLSAHGTDAPILAALTVGSPVTITTAITAGWEDVVEAVSGREWLVEAAQESVRPVSSITTAEHPRTAVALRGDGRLVLATVDGRWPGYSVGVTATELAGMLLSQGAQKAIMLDGGGSTTALVRRPGDVEASLVNRPSDGQERAVDNGLLVVSSTPTGPLANVIVRPGDARAFVGETVTFQAKGVDAALNGVSISGVPVSWSVAGGAGTVASNGVFRARSPGDATVTATVSGQSGDANVTVVPDTSAPTPSAPVTRLDRGATVSPSAVRMTVSWPAAADIGSGVARYELRRRLDGGAWTAVALPSATSRSVTQSLSPVRAVQYQLRATDRAGNVSAWKYGPTFYARLVHERSGAVQYKGSWPVRTSSAFLGGSVKSSRSRGSTATFTFTGSQVAWIASRGPARGTARISIDGTAVATVSLRSETLRHRKAVFTYAWNSVGKHRITVRVLGGRRVDVDGFAVVDGASPYPVLVGAGDVADCGSSGDSATAALLDRIPGTVFVAGDAAYPTGTAAQFANCYNPTWGRFKGRTRPAPGNHEYLTSGAAPYFSYFGSRAGTAGQGWYAYDLGTWRVYSLNANCELVGGCGPGSAQEAWLRADLAANPRACVAAIWHQPLFSSGIHGGTVETRPLWDALYEAGADLVINGHDHNYERFAPQRPDGTVDAAAGIREFVVGTGGAEKRTLATIQPNSEARKAGIFGILKLELKPAGYTWRFVPVSGTTFTDTGEASCH